MKPGAASEIPDTPENRQAAVQRYLDVSSAENMLRDTILESTKHLSQEFLGTGGGVGNEAHQCGIPGESVVGRPAELPLLIAKLFEENKSLSEVHAMSGCAGRGVDSI